MKQTAQLSFYLAVKEILRHKGRFFLVSLVIALITLLVLFVAALGEGLGNGNREYLSKLPANLIVYQERSDRLIAASRLGRDSLAAARRVEGVQDVGLLATTNAVMVPARGVAPIKVALLGVDVGHVAEPPVLQGEQLSTSLAQEVILDRQTALRTKAAVGDQVTLRVTQGTREEEYALRIVGIAGGQQYGLQPSIFVPFDVWDRVRPKSAAEVGVSSGVGNVVLVRVADPAQVDAVAQRIGVEVAGVETATIQQAIEALPGYTAQQGTLNTQGFFTLFIGILVIGGFFQIQALQKVPQIGVLKAIGTDTPVVGAAAVVQIVIVTVVGVVIGGFLSFLFSLTFPPTIPIVFNGITSALALAALMVIGPLGGLVSVLYAVRVEPLKALGLSS